MKPKPIHSTLDIEYLEHESLSLEINDLERENFKKYRNWIIFTPVLLVGLIIFFRLVIQGLIMSIAAFFIFIATAIYCIFKILKSYDGRTPYFFDAVTFYSNQIVMKKGKEIKTLNLKPPYLFDLVINQKEKRTVVEIENFGERLLVFQLDSLQDLPTVTDALADLYQLDYQDFNDLDNNVQLFSYHSKVEKTDFSLIEFQEKVDTLIVKIIGTKKAIEFDWNRNICTFFDNNLATNVFIINEINDISWNFKWDDKTPICYIDLLYESTNYAFLKIPIPPNLSKMTVFQSALKFVNNLKYKPQLQHIEIDFIRNSGDD